MKSSTQHLKAQLALKLCGSSHLMLISLHTEKRKAKLEAETLAGLSLQVQ